MGQKIYLYTINPLYINSYSILVDFYMPLISNQAISLYYYLENKVKENIKVLEMENIISETKFDSTKILMIRKYLEAVELINTYKDNNEELHIVLNGVKSPKQLLTDIRFKTLIESIKNKLSLFCSVPVENVIDSIDVQNIYQIPINYYEQKIDEIVKEIEYIDQCKAILIHIKSGNIDISIGYNLINSILKHLGIYI